MYLVSQTPSFLLYTMEINEGPNDILYETKFSTAHALGLICFSRPGREGIVAQSE